MISFYVLDKFKYTNGNFSHTKKTLDEDFMGFTSFIWINVGCDDFVKFSYMKTLMCTPMSMKMGLG